MKWPLFRNSAALESSGLVKQRPSRDSADIIVTELPSCRGYPVPSYRLCSAEIGAPLCQLEETLSESNFAASIRWGEFVFYYSFKYVVVVGIAVLLSGCYSASLSNRWIMGYYPAWENTSGLLPVNKVTFAYLTHIAFGAVIPISDGTLNTNFYIDATNGPALAVDVASRAHAAGKKALLMVGGTGSASSGFAGAAGDTYRATFVANLINTKNTLGYDGIDIDWEPIPTDTTNYQKLIQDLRTADPTMLLTTVVPQVNPNYQTAKPVFFSIWPLVDRINIMTYDMAYNGTGWLSWHNTPLMRKSSQTPTSVKSSVDAYLDAGVPRQKLGIGSPFYGQAWRGVTGPQQSLAGATQVGNDSLLSYRNILSVYYTTEACRWDDVAKVPYLTFAVQTGPVGATYISYENERSVLEKAEYIKNQQLGGIIIWTLGEGYLADGTQPLLQAIYGGLFGNANP